MKNLTVIMALLSSIGCENAYCSPKDGFTKDCNWEDEDFAQLVSLEEQLKVARVNSMIDPMSRGTKITIDGKDYRCIQHSDDSIKSEKY